ncbi:hypothetical protein VdG1_04562 [Verticillium dahliae VDG1]|nr:hypothetical protein VdG1_04562 [Verticillium dahliae VDG1]
MPYWQQLFSTGHVDAEGNPNITTSQESAIVSILSAGTFFGALFSPLLSDYIGRRMGLMISTWVFNLGVVLHTIATSIPLFLAGRFFAGLGVGLISAMNNAEQAAKSLSRLRRLPTDHQAIVAELAEVHANHEFEMRMGQGSYLDCFKPPILKRQLTGMALQALQQLTGINFIFYYGTKYFENSGVSSGFTVSMITSAINVASTIPGMYAVDKWGRRPLLLWGAIGMCISQLIVAVSGTVSSGQHENGEIFVKSLGGQRAAVSFVCIYIFFFASTWGPLAWVVTGEIFPLKTRAKSLSITTATNWLLNWAIAYSTPYLVNYGEGYANLQSKIFFVWFGACFICIIFVWLMIYETKGLSLEEVDQLYEEVRDARKSSQWKPTPSWDNDTKKQGNDIALGEVEHTAAEGPPQPDRH